MQNFSENFLLDPVLDGEVVLPGGDVAEPFIDADDIADVAVAALTEEGHVGQVYEVTGPRLLTFADAVAEIAAATGRQIRYVPVTPEQYAAALTSTASPSDVVELLTYLFTTSSTAAMPARRRRATSPRSASRATSRRSRRRRRGRLGRRAPVGADERGPLVALTVAAARQRVRAASSSPSRGS